MKTAVVSGVINAIPKVGPLLNGIFNFGCTLIKSCEEGVSFPRAVLNGVVDCSFGTGLSCMSAAVSKPVNVNKKTGGSVAGKVGSCGIKKISKVTKVNRLTQSWRITKGCGIAAIIAIAGMSAYANAKLLLKTNRR